MTLRNLDASSKGMGAVLLQDDGPFACASHQCKYAQIEKEMLAIVFGCTEFHDYIIILWPPKRPCRN